MNYSQEFLKERLERKKVDFEDIQVCTSFFRDHMHDVLTLLVTHLRRPEEKEIHDQSKKSAGSFENALKYQILADIGAILATQYGVSMHFEKASLKSALESKAVQDALRDAPEGLRSTIREELLSEIISFVTRDVAWDLFEEENPGLDPDDKTLDSLQRQLDTVARQILA